MAVPDSGNPVTILGLAREKVYDSYTNDSIPKPDGTNTFPYPLDGLVWAPDARAVRHDAYQDTTVFCPVNHVANSGGSLRMEATSANSYTGTYNHASYRHSPGTVSETFVFSFYAKSESATEQVRTYMFSAASSGAIIANGPYNYPNANGAYVSAYHNITSAWGRYSQSMQLCDGLPGSGDCAYVQARCDVIGSSDTVWWDGFQIEEDTIHAATDFTMNGPYSMYDLANGTGTYSSVTFDETNEDSDPPDPPDDDPPHAMDEWYGYDHDAEGGGGGGGGEV